tara:strand:+ start:1326 stop:2297 length:972 start_codon:yes stop_codon:yes gene_type:complete
MALAGFFRQHFSSGGENLSRILKFVPSNLNAGQTLSASQVARIRTTVNAFGGGGGNPNGTLSLWIYPRTLTNQTSSTIQTIYSNYDTTPTNGWPEGTALDDKLQYYLRLQNGKLDIHFFRRRLNDSQTTITYNQWNHILISAQISNNTVNGNKDDKFILVVNGNQRNYFIGGNDNVTLNNDFGSDYDGNSRSGDALISSDNEMAFTWGAQATVQDDGPDGNGGTVAGFYKNPFFGEMFQFAMFPGFIDVRTENNINFFRKSGSHVSNDLLGRNTAITGTPYHPGLGSPRVLLTDYKEFNSGSNTGINTSLAKSNIFSSSLPRP